MKSTSIEFLIKIWFSAMVIVLIFSTMIGSGFARGYGSGDGIGQNYSDYVSMEKIRIFESYDANKDGYLIFEEIAVMKISNNLFIRMDLNNNGNLSRDEFAKLLDII